MNHPARWLMSAFGLLSCLSSIEAQQCASPPLLPAYSHNDYRNQQPLQGALALGYQGVEADYILDDGELLVGHGRGEVMSGRTLERLYLAPLRDRVRRCGRVQSTERRFLLTLDYKDQGPRGYQTLRDLLQKYPDVVGTREEPGPVQVVLVGGQPPLRELARDSLQLLTVQATITRSGLEIPKGDTALVGIVSLDYGKTMCWRGTGPVSSQDRKILQQLSASRRALPGRLVRAYNVPPDSAVYRLLLSSGVDLIGTKELQKTAGMLRAD